ncbi:MAG: holo-ACP synthase [Armatimonadetes bacterium]|jgi:holo-[acyl-carrier protein] synthase|nr:holo-ACP synthase [Armatimonadota bacterium]MCA1995630.1 holo-ACP synthase [Armatimonadota bacterium]
MIAGLGIDLVSVDRIRRAMANPKFAERILTSRERSACEGTAEHLAGRWAAKEAVAKCLGRPLRWHDVEILPDANGTPKAWVRQGVLPDGWSILVSITHERTMAAAVAALVAPSHAASEPME